MIVSSIFSKTLLIWLRAVLIVMPMVSANLFAG
jgi:hypothetical protein